jgi:hypothetical protein
MDYAIAIDRLLPGAKWLQSGSYAELVATWGDVQPVPSDAALIAAYAEWEADQVILAARNVIQSGAKAQAANIPNFARWTEQQGLDWIAANIGNGAIDAVTNLADAKALMKKQAVAFNATWRVDKSFLNHTWPDLENSE